MSFRRAVFHTALAVAGVLLFTAGSAESITVRPAAFDHIEASVPEEVMAGVEFKVSITFVDRYGNPMSRDWKPETSLTLHVSQPASVQPPILTPQNYVPGFTYSVHTEKMGELTLSLRDDKGKVLDQWSLTIKSGRPVKFLVDIPSRAEVGETVTMSLQALDAHGNVAFGYAPQAQSIIVEDRGVSIEGTVQSRPGGIYEFPIRFREKGQRSISVRDRTRGLAGSSSVINVTPAPLGSFDIQAPSSESAAGKELAVTIRALDRYGSLLTDYSDRYKGVRLYSGEAAIVPDLVSPASFNEGIARVGITMRNAGDHRIEVSELQSNISGEFVIRITPAVAKTLRISTPDSAVAGEPFQIILTSEDEYGNRTASLPPGASVRLESTGTGKLIPEKIESSAFRDGVARIMVSYEKAESFDINARLSFTGEEAAPGSAMAEKENARSAAQRAREEAMRARREARLRQRRVTEEAPPAPRPEAPAAGQEKREQPVPSPPKGTQPALRSEPVKPPEGSPAVASLKKPLRPGVLDRIAVVEDEKRALVTFSTNGMTDYNVTTSAKLSRKWIDIEFPDMAVDLPDRIGGGEKIVGEVYVEPSVGGGRGVTVSVEILPTRIGYDVYLEGQSIVLKVNRQ